jgi:hypothetical protein
MTLLNIASDGYYNVLIVLYRAVIDEGPIAQEKLLNLCSDMSDGSRKRIQETLNRWTELGLFKLEDGTISLSNYEKSAGKKEKSLELATRNLPSVIRSIVFSEENNDRFWDREKTRSADLTRGLSWLMAQNIYAFSLSNLQEVQQLEARQLNDRNRRIIQNDVRFNGLRTWAGYLGFLWRSKGLMIDPTEAVRQELPTIFGNRKDLAADTFSKQVAIVLPVLDEGRYRIMLEQVLDPTHWQKPEREDVLSMSLSRAIWRLENLGIIGLVARADAKVSRVVQRSDGTHWKAFTHIRYQGMSK